MKSNITLRSNVYINKTARDNDVDFLQHITDYRILKDRKKNANRYTHGDLSWLTPMQQDILIRGQPDCSLEHGTMSWGVPIGGDHMVCRCEQRDCSMYGSCSQYWNFEEIVREETPEALPPETPSTDPLPLYDGKVQAEAVPQAAGATQPQPGMNSSDTKPFTTSSGANPDKSFKSESGEPHQTVENVAPAQGSHESLDFGKGVIPEPVQDANTAAGQTPYPGQDKSVSGFSNFSVDNDKQIASPGQVPQPQPEPAHKALLTQDATTKAAAADAVPVVEQAAIIDAPTDIRVWVNAGPGCGKTYTVIRRLKKLLEAGPERSVVVLCYSRNAVHVIQERLAGALGEQAWGWKADGTLVVRTFDSFATYMLCDELDTSWDYDRRIEEFIAMLGRNPGVLDEMVGYLVVDEIQDIVGVRARMLLAMLDNLKCGAMLLGDRAQAIFDWLARDKHDMTFGTLSKELMRRGLLRFEMSGNRRQVPALAEASRVLRVSMLVGGPEEQEAALARFKGWVSGHWDGCKATALASRLHGSDDLVLCRTNGGAARISAMLYACADPVDHVLRQSARHAALAPWIAKALCGNDGHTLSHSSFMANAAKWNLAEADALWDVLKSLDGNLHAPTLQIPELLEALRITDSLPAACLNGDDDCVVVSTIHRAKGSEAKRVFWLDEPLVYDSHASEEGALEDGLKAAYVAATRAREEIHMVDWGKQFYMLNVGNNRWISTRPTRNHKKFCSGIALIPEDVDSASFACGDDAQKRQETIAGIARGMPVELYLDNVSGRYEIYCDGVLIGLTSGSFSIALRAGMDATNHSRKLPVRIDEVYISSVISVVGCTDASVDPFYAEAGCWLGVELGGFAKTHWS